jgi:restriction system protein
LPIPDFQTLMLPVLRRAAAGRCKAGDLIPALAGEFALTAEDRTALLPSGRQTTIANRTHWAITYLAKAGLLGRVARGEYEATEAGRALLAEAPARITLRLLHDRYAEIRRFRARQGADTGDHAGALDETVIAVSAPANGATPDDAISDAIAAIEAKVRADLLERLTAMPPGFFEKVVVDLLVAMGYGGSAEDAGERLGRAGDGGVDGVIREDRLGLDLIYIQAKRYAPDRSIGPDAIRSFAGALDEFGARKGVFLTTAGFTAAAETYAKAHQTKRIVLIDGERLTLLMLRHDVGVRADRTITVKRLDLDYFEPDEGV